MNESLSVDDSFSWLARTADGCDSVVDMTVR